MKTAKPHPPEWASLTMRNGLVCRIRGGTALLDEVTSFLAGAESLEKHPNLKLLMAASVVEEPLARQARDLLLKGIT